jgi:acetyltransferase-like isoleucine patch superfamily enzyme
MGADAAARSRNLQPQYPRWGVRRAARFAVEHRMLTPVHVLLYARYARMRLRRPGVTFHGMAFLGPDVDLFARRGRGRLEIGPWCWIGKGNSIRAHEGSVRLGAKVVLGSHNVVNGYLDIEIGADALLSDWIYITDFDHHYGDLARPIRKQGIAKTPVRIGEDVWIGEKASILRGADIGAGSVIGSQTVVKGHIPPFSVAVGAPARVIRSRLPAGMTAEEAIDLRRHGRRIPGDPLTDPH